MFPPRGLHLNGSSLIINAERIERAVRFYTLFAPFSPVNNCQLTHTRCRKKVLGTLTSTQPNKSFM